MTRYQRQMVLPEIGLAGQARIAAARILVVGAGGLAASALPLLAAAGVGRITIVDGDRVEQSNLHRQVLFSEGDQGRPKADVAAERCRALNREVTVVPWRRALTPANAARLIEPADIVLDCADSYAVSYTLSDLCAELRVPLISASVLGVSGYVGGFCGPAPSLRAVFPEAPQNAASCATAGVMGPVVSMLGAAQAQMALAVAVELDPSPLGQMLTFDMGGYRTSGFRFDGAPEPVDYYPFVAQEELTNNDLIVDLRSTAEAARVIRRGARRVAPDDLTDWLKPDDRRLVLCCASGLRAWRAAETVQETWPGEIVLVAAKAS
ncbi:MAG: ThiF family adenylyltransferase [Paracoccaceae bacterium]|nr:ThiF family adenylyltransferase [Paracoccaceae bacterium]